MMTHSTKEKRLEKEQGWGGGDAQNLRKGVNNKGWLPIMSGKTDLQKGKNAID